MRPPKMRKLSTVEGVSALHAEPFNEFGEKSWPYYTLHKAADLKLCEHHLDCIFVFLFETVRVLLMGGYQS